ncbi:TetR/AcrR family transcriptional regulator [Acidovorax sp. SUPP3434]|uniref:TetR/AcrR family transcriptional regulator n=1 Tax=Acidovorax sp. SUPP3434 TaxID=2920880 RepID=UPI0023DE4772|nr:TetR/AcrR family transcriptional regulator [Acidovorax sp. SUPP3434]GKS98257.1 TetR/AcrR family transcriptional regulator [Acidovorax sp. SUPP3434]
MNSSPSPSPAPPPSTEASKRERRKEARPGELLDAALELFVEKGYAATKVDEVAARAGVSKGTLFLYFPSKEDLFKEVVRQNIGRHFPEWDLEIDQYPHSTAELLRYAYQLWWERIGATPASGITKLMLGESNNFPDIVAFYRNEVVEPGQRLIGRILQRGVDRGEFRVPDMDCSIHVVLAPLIFMTMWKHSTACMPDLERLTPERFIAAQVDNLLCGLCVPVAAPPAAPKIEG